MYKLNSNIFYKTINENKIMLVDIYSEETTMMEIYGVSAEVFLALVEGQEVEAVTKMIAQKYSVSQEQVSGDIQVLLKDLAEHKVFALEK